MLTGTDKHTLSLIHISHGYTYTCTRADTDTHAHTYMYMCHTGADVHTHIQRVVISGYTKMGLLVVVPRTVVAQEGRPLGESLKIKYIGTVNMTKAS